MGRFEFDPTKVVANFEIFPKGEYELLIGEPKAFLRQAGEDKHDSFGIRYPFVVKLPGEYDGKRGIFSTYYQTEGSAGMAKQFIMAVLGYGKGAEEEKRFDNDYRGKDWGMDPETGGVGDMYRELSGKRVIASLDITKNNQKGSPQEGEPQQSFKSWRPLNSGPIAA